MIWSETTHANHIVNRINLSIRLASLASALLMYTVLTIGFLLANIAKSLPDASDITSVELQIPLRVYSADGKLISEYGNERRKPVELQSVPQPLIDAVLASEDDKFRKHFGIDIFGMARSVLANISSGQRSQGASTITQQVARNFFLTPEKTYIRKIKEIILALRLEQLLSKDQILSLYINKIYLGHRAYGFGAAAEVYYDSDLNELNLAQFAMLAGIPKAPSRMNPLTAPQRAISRRNYVLNRLLSLDKISQSEYDTASTAEVSAEKRVRKNTLQAPHIAELVRAEIIHRYGEEAYWQGLSVYTTIQSNQQQAATIALRKGLKSYDQRHGFRGPVAKISIEELLTLGSLAESLDFFNQRLASLPSSMELKPAAVYTVEDEFARVYIKDFGFADLRLEDSQWAKRFRTVNIVGPIPKKMHQLVTSGDIVYVEPMENEDTDPPLWKLSQIPLVSGALISLDPNNGNIISLVGGFDYFLNKYNRATQSIRQPGSNIKPFIYSAALEKGFTPASMISGAPIVLTDPVHGTRWRPENYSGKFYGPTRIREALSRSMNLVSVRLLRSIGIPYAREYLQRFGIDMDRFRASLTMALGSGGITPMEMLSAYAVLANGGYKIQTNFIDQIRDRNQRIIYRAPLPELCDLCFEPYFLQANAVNPDEIVAERQSLSSDTSDENEDTLEDSATTALESATTLLNKAFDEQLADVVASTYTAERVMTSANNWLTVNMLKDVIRRGTARKALRLNRPDLAGKTGTTNDYVDAWFSGFNANVATTVWVGYDEPTTMGRGESGSSVALPIWIDYMEAALADSPVMADPIPTYIEPVLVDRHTGQRVSDAVAGAITEYFVLAHKTPERGWFADLLLDPLTPTAMGDAELVDVDQQIEIQPPTNEKIMEVEDETEGLF